MTMVRIWDKKFFIEEIRKYPKRYLWNCIWQQMQVFWNQNIQFFFHISFHILKEMLFWSTFQNKNSLDLIVRSCFEFVKQFVSVLL